MNYYVRKHDRSIAGPMSQADFLARLGSGEFASTDEMSTDDNAGDGRVWTRIGLTGFASRARAAARDAALASSVRLGSVVGKLTGGPLPAPGAGEELKRPVDAFDSTPPTLHARGSRPPRPPRFWRLHPWLSILLAASAAALVWFLVRLFASPDGRPGPRPASVPSAYGESASGAYGESASRAASEIAGPPASGTVAAFLEPSAAEVRNSFEAVRSSPAVQENARYSAIARGIGCQLLEDSVVNAYAGWRKLESGEQVRTIWYTAGHFRFDRVVAAMTANAVFRPDASPAERASALDGLLRWMPAVLREGGGRLDESSAAEGLAKAGIDDSFFSDAKSASIAVAIAEGVAISTFSHEMGHHVLGHLDEKGASSTGLAGNRAKEEQADAFAVEVMDSKTGEGRDAMFLGRFLWSFQMAVADTSESDAGSTHPLARRRLRSLIESDPDLSKKFGFDFDKISKLLDGLKAADSVASAGSGLALGGGSADAPLRAENPGFGSSAPENGGGKRLLRVNPAYLKWVEESDNGSLKTESGTDGRSFGFVPDYCDMSYLSAMRGGVAGESGLSRPAKAGARKYDLRAENAVTGVRDQNPYGTCWAHAACGSMESALLRSTGKAFDLSENNLVNGNGLVSGWNGGNAGAASAYFLRWGGPLLEKDDAYPDPKSAKTAAPAFHVQRIRWIPGKNGDLDHDRIKDALVSYGALWVAFQWEDDCASGRNGVDYRYCGAPKGNHAVTLVGWDDDYPKERFKNVPPGNGAYLVKNSWGTGNGDAGYNWISYYDTSFARAEAVGMLYAYDGAEPASNYGRIYQHDPYGFVMNFPWTFNSTGGFPAFGANVFTAEGDDTVSAVGFYALGPSTSYSVSVFTGCSADDPTSGTAVVSGQTGTLDTAGFFTVPLASAVRVSRGERFSVVVRLSTPGLDSPLAMELVETLGGRVLPSAKISAGEGQSFVSPDGKQWLDVYAASPGNRANFCCKAYANAGPGGVASEAPAAGGGETGELRLVLPASGAAGVNQAFADWSESDGGAEPRAENGAGGRATGLAPEVFDMSRLPGGSRESPREAAGAVGGGD